MIRIYIFFIFIANFSYGQTEKLYSTDDLKTDILFLKQKLEKNHPNLYLYSDKKHIDTAFDSLTNSIKTPMTELEFYKHISIISSIIKDGHTNIIPSKSITSYHNANSKFIPYKFKIVNNHLYVEMVLTINDIISEGVEITSINGTDTKTILKQLTERQVRDGYNETYPLWIIDNYFREYYSYIFGHPTQFLIQYNTKDGKKETTIAALSKDTINYYRQLKYPKKSFTRKPNEGITYMTFPNFNYACLTIKDFHKNVLKREYKQNFKTEIKNAFEQLSNSNIENLILDLRNNQGGDIKYGAYLLSYLINKDFSVVEQYYKVSNSKYRLTKTKGQAQGTYSPKDICFKGKLYILINGGSFSNSGIVATALRQHTKAIFVGTETGGNNKVLAGYIKDFNFPNTKIHIQIPTKQFMLNESLPLTGQGTRPDYETYETIEYILSNRDTQKNYVVKLIDDKNGR